jgi:acetyl-CoA acyltransferase
VFRFKRPDELAAETIQYMMNELPDFDKTRIDDVMVEMPCLAGKIA